VTGVAVWHTNADEPTVLDYNLEFKTDDRYAPEPYRASDHDPVVVGLMLSPDAPAYAATLAAVLPGAGQATLPVAIEGLQAQPTPGATGVQLTVDWGDGTGPQLLLPTQTRAEHVYAAAGRYTVTLRLVQDGSLPAELTAPVAIAPAPVVVQAGLYISEYIEGSSFNKAIEIYNPGTAAVDLSRYTLRLYANGAATASASITLDGLLAPGGTYVLCHPSIAAATLPRCQRTSSTVINFNGDDALTLEREGSVVDQFGQVGFDPGSAWVDGSVSTVDRTLRRKAGVTQGSVPPGAPGVWSLASEWDGFPVNTLDGLGAR
jgi:predicted extracellular nuclease